MRVYVVLEDDRDYGPTIVGVFASHEAAQQCAEQSCRYYVCGGKEGHEVEGVES